MSPDICPQISPGVEAVEAMAAAVVACGYQPLYESEEAFNAAVRDGSAVPCGNGQYADDSFTTFWLDFAGHH